MVACVESVLLPPYRVWIAKLVYFTCLRRQAKQKVRPTMKELAVREAGRVTLQASDIAAEPETSAHGLERAALRLKVIELGIHIIDAKPERVCTLHPGQVRRSDELVITKLKWVSRIIVADIGPPSVDLEGGNAPLQEIRAVGAGNLQHLQPEVRNDIKTLGAQVLARVSKVCVQNNRGTERVGAANSEDINRARSCSQLPAI